MAIIEVLQSVLVSVLSVYLSVTGLLAHFIENSFSPSEVETHHAESTIPSESPTSSPSEELTLLSRLYASAGSISRILSESTEFKQAAQTIGSISPESDRAAAPQTDDIERALVNIFCEYTTDRYTRTTTGSGFFITETGVILTNAHVAQFLLLESVEDAEGSTECVIRSGNPAEPRYNADLLFISPSWIFENAKLITEEHPQGTGEYDYALLYVTSSLTDAPLPSAFEHLSLHTEFLSKQLVGKEVMTAGYPAERLLRDGPKATLLPTVAGAYVAELYTFGSNYADIFGVTASAVGEHGASGGPVVSDSLGTIGLIVTKGDQDEDGDTSLRALSLSYINRTILEETGFNLVENARGDLAYRGKVFKEILAPHLTALLVHETTPR